MEGIQKKKAQRKLNLLKEKIEGIRDDIKVCMYVERKGGRLGR